MADPSRAPDETTAAQYGRLEVALLAELLKRIESGEASSSELATAAALLGKAGTPARSAGAGAKGSEVEAGIAWLRSLTPEQQAQFVRDASAASSGPRPVSRRAAAG